MGMIPYVDEEDPGQPGIGLRDDKDSGLIEHFQAVREDWNRIPASNSEIAAAMKRMIKAYIWVLAILGEGP